MSWFARPIVVATATAILLAISSCAPYSGSARPIDPATVSGPGWLGPVGVPLVRQQRHADCGAAAMAMVASFWNGPISEQEVLAITPHSRRGIRAGDLRVAARTLGLRAFVVEGTFADLRHELGNGRPVVVGLVKPMGDQTRNHYEVVVGINEAKRTIATLDPAAGWRQNSYQAFALEWARSGRVTVVVLPTTRVSSREG